MARGATREPNRSLRSWCSTRSRRELPARGFVASAPTRVGSSRVLTLHRVENPHQDGHRLTELRRHLERVGDIKGKLLAHGKRGLLRSPKGREVFSRGHAGGGWAVKPEEPVLADPEFVAVIKPSCADAGPIDEHAGRCSQINDPGLVAIPDNGCMKLQTSRPARRTLQHGDCPMRTSARLTRQAAGPAFP